MRRDIPLTVAGLAAAIAALLLVRGERVRPSAGGAGVERTDPARLEDRSARQEDRSAWQEDRSARPPRPGSMRAPHPGAPVGDPRRPTLPGALPATASSGDSPVARALASYSSDELALLARFERLTGRAAPPALLALVARRRTGAPADELVALASRSFAGDPLGRAAALEWLRERPAR